MSGIVDGADDAAAVAAAIAAIAADAAAIIAAAPAAGVAVGGCRLVSRHGRQWRRGRLAVGVGESEESAVPRDLLGVGDPVEQVADLQHALLGHGHNLVLKETDNRQQ